MRIGLDIPEWENYQITKDGDIWSKKSDRWLKPQVNGCGYVHIELNEKGNTKTFLIHRLVAIVFIPNPNGLPEINHKDGNKENNNNWNLEWSTSSENQIHAYKKGLQIHSKGEDWHPSKLTEKDIIYIRKNCIPKDLKVGYNALGRLFDVAAGTISDAFNKKTWRHI